MVRVRRLAAWIGGPLFVVGFLNMVAYQVHLAALGDGAFHERDGRAYLNNHGRVTELSADQAGWVAWHGRCVAITCGAGVLGWALCMPAILSQRPDAEPGAAPDTGRR
jgi:hypothetical protein